MCNFIFLAVCREHDKDWASDEILILKNHRHELSANTDSSEQLSGIYGLECAFESDPDTHIVIIRVFAKESMHFLP